MSSDPMEPGVFLAAVIAALGAAWGWITLHFGLKDRVTKIETQFDGVREDIHRMDKKLDELINRKYQR